MIRLSSILSLSFGFLSIVGIAAWGWGHFRTIALAYDLPPDHLTLGVSGGKLYVSTLRENENDISPRGARVWSVWMGDLIDLDAHATVLFPGSRPPVFGFFAGRTLLAGEEQGLAFAPMWAVVGLLAIGPMLAGMGAYRRRRRRALEAAVRCVGCGYDLRATPTRCPECGREVR